MKHTIFQKWNSKKEVCSHESYEVSGMAVGVAAGAGDGGRTGLLHSAKGGVLMRQLFPIFQTTAPDRIC